MYSTYFRKLQLYIYIQEDNTLYGRFWSLCGVKFQGNAFPCKTPFDFDFLGVGFQKTFMSCSDAMGFCVPPGLAMVMTSFENSSKHRS